MQTVSCANCGAAIDSTTRFCRHCGHPQDPSELTTRSLEEPARFETPTQPANSGFTSPAYLPPEAFHLQASATRAMEQPSQKKTIITLSIIIAVLLVVLSGLGLFLFFQGPNFAQPPRILIPPPRAEVPQPPGVPTPPGMPHAPTAPVPAIFKELLYPGSQIIMDTSDSDGRTIHLRTSDPTDKVIDWYKDRIKPSKQVNIPGISAMLEGSDFEVIILFEGNSTGILLAQKNR